MPSKRDEVRRRFRSSYCVLGMVALCFLAMSAVPLTWPRPVLPEFDRLHDIIMSVMLTMVGCGVVFCVFLAIAMRCFQGWAERQLDADHQSHG